MYDKQKLERSLSETQPNLSIDGILDDVEQAIRNGQNQHAYILSLEATQVEPDNAEVWLLRARLAPSLEERILCVNRLNELEPDYHDRHNIAFFALKELLDYDPFLAYLDETEDLYRVLNSNRIALSIPKKRSARSSHLQQRTDKLTAAHRWLTLAFLGLLLAGIGTLVFAPLAAWSAFNAGQSIDSRTSQVRSAVVLVTSVVLFVIGLSFSFLFVLHVMG